MPSLHTIPCELRLQILTYVLLSPSSRPPRDPSASQDRIESSYLVSKGVRGIWLENKAPVSLALPLLLVNRLINREIRDILSARPETKEWRLDVMWVKSAGIWPTWTYLPVLTDHINSLLVTFRIFSPPAGIDAKFDNSLVINSDWWDLCGFIHRFIMQGPWSHVLSESLSDEKANVPRLSMRRLIIDVKRPRGDENHDIIARILSRPTWDICPTMSKITNIYRVNPFGEIEIYRQFWHCSEHVDPKDIPAERLACLLALRFKFALATTWGNFEGWPTLYERIHEDITFIANGEIKCTIDLEEKALRDGPPYYPNSQVSPIERGSEEMANWEAWLPYAMKNRRLFKERESNMQKVYFA